MKETVEKQVIPADVAPALITLAVAKAQRWYRPKSGMYTLASALAAGWRGQPMTTVVRPSSGGVGGDYWLEWPGGSVCQQTRSCPPETESILATMWQEYDRQNK